MTELKFTLSAIDNVTPKIEGIERKFNKLAKGAQNPFLPSDIR